MFGMILISLLSDRNNIEDKFRMFLPAWLYLDDTIKKFNMLFIIDKNILQVNLSIQTKFISTDLYFLN